MYLSHIFPELACVYPKNQPMTFRFGIENDLTTQVTFHEGRAKGILSPKIFFHVGQDLAFTLAFSASFDLNMDFSIADLKSYVKLHINELDMKDWKFTAGTVHSIDLIQLAEAWNPFLLPLITNQVNNVIEKQGLEIGVVTALRDIFNVDLQTFFLKLSEGYLQGSFNVNIYKKGLRLMFPYSEAL